MNRITNAERERILERAIELTDMDRASGLVLNGQQVVGKLIAEFSISKERALHAAAKAARRMRHPNWGGKREGAGRPYEGKDL